MRSKHAYGLVSLGIFLLVNACVGDDAMPRIDSTGDAGASSSSSSGMPSGDAATLPSIALAAPSVRVRRGQSASVGITLTRRGLMGDVSVTASSLPSGLGAMSVVVAGGDTTAMFTFTASASATQGRATVRLQAPGFSDAALDVVVAGTPGSLDESFDGDGFVLSAPTAAGLYYGMAIQPDGKVIVVGGRDPVNGAWVIQRFNEDGMADTAFNTAAATAIPTTGSARAVAIDPATGRIVVVGQSGAGPRLTVLRRNANGSSDDGFGSAGTTVVDSVAHSQSSIGLAVTVLADSSVLVAGSRNTVPLGIVEKFSAAGVRVTSGFVTFTMVNEGVLNAIFPVAGGSFVATGTNELPAPQNQLVVRLVGNGTPDETFAVGGLRNYSNQCSGLGAALAKNGDVILVGQDIAGPTPCQTRIAASTTGTLGFTTSTGLGTSDRFTAAAADPDSDMTYSVGYGGGTNDRYAMIERRTLGGALDTTFGTGGRVLFEDPMVGDTYRFELRAAATMPDGRLLVAGLRHTSMPAPAEQFAIARLWP